MPIASTMTLTDLFTRQRVLPNVVPSVAAPICGFWPARRSVRSWFALLGFDSPLSSKQLASRLPHPSRLPSFMDALIGARFAWPCVSMWRPRGLLAVVLREALVRSVPPWIWPRCAFLINSHRPVTIVAEKFSQGSVGSRPVQVTGGLKLHCVSAIVLIIALRPRASVVMRWRRLRVLYG